MMAIDLDSLTLTDIIRLQNQLSNHLTSRFEKWLSVMFSDIVGSTAYFQRYGDNAGHQLQQRHFDLLVGNLEGSGKLFDTAGDGAILTFASTEAAAEFSIRFQRALSDIGRSIPAEQQWQTHTCIHWGPVLSDGVTVAGDTINLCCKLSSLSRPGQILLTSRAMEDLPKRLRHLCDPAQTVKLSGMAETSELFQLRWRNPHEIPRYLLIVETGQRITIPEKTVVSCGRFSGTDPGNSNDIVLTLPDLTLSGRISRWHFELRSEGNKLFLRAVSDKSTVVNGVQLRKGEQALIEDGASVRLSDVMTLRFDAEKIESSQQDVTLIQQVLH